MDTVRGSGRAGQWDEFVTKVREAGLERVRTYTVDFTLMNMRTFAVLGAFTMALTMARTIGAQPVPVYLPFADVERRLADVARQNSALVKLEAIGTSAGGRKIHLLTIAAEGKVAPAQRPAVFVGANIVGFHNAGSHAAVAFVEKLLAKKDDAAVKKLLESRTFYVAPALNPDAHDAMFSGPKARRSGNGATLDRDLDGLVGEDGPNDLNGDGRITMMRVPDAAGEWLVDEKDARLMRRADPMKGEKGKYKLMAEGIDDDKDGQFNEDGPGGYRPDKNFAHAWNETDVESGPWPSASPETKAVLDFVVKHRNVAMAFVFGPANNLLEMPRGGAGARGGDVGSMKVTPPRQLAAAFGLEPGKEYTIDEIWELAKDSPIVRAQGGTKEQFAQFLGGGPATSPDAEDLKFYQNFGEEYKKLLEKAGLDTKRAGGQSAPGGLQNWLYYQHSLMAVELDVWGIPKKAAARPATGGVATSAGGALTIEAFEKMTAAEVAALDDEKLAAFLKSVNAPAMATPAMIKQGAASGRMSPAQMVAMMRSQGGGRPAAGGAPAGGAPMGGPVASGSSGSTMPDEDTIAYVDASAKEGFAAWTPVTLPDGTKVEVGGVDPFLAVAPNEETLKKAVDVHADALLWMAGKMAEVALDTVEVKALGSGIYKVSATAVNNGFLPTATRLQVRTRSFLPARLTISLPSGATLVQGSKRSANERIAGSGGTHKAEWMVNATPGTRVTVSILTQNAGEDRKEVVLQ
jgi:hypothetical protein